MKRIKEMACEVLKIVNNVPPTFIKNLIAFKCSQYSVQKDKPVVVPNTNTSIYGLKSFVNGGPRSGTVCRTNYEKTKTMASSTDCSGTGMIPCASVLPAGKPDVLFIILSKFYLCTCMSFIFLILSHFIVLCLVVLQLFVRK